MYLYMYLKFERVFENVAENILGREGEIDRGDKTLHYRYSNVFGCLFLSNNAHKHFWEGNLFIKNSLFTFMLP